MLENLLDMRMVCIFSLPAFVQQNHRRPFPTPVESHTSAYGAEHIAAKDTLPGVQEPTIQKYTRLQEACARYNLTMQRDGRFFMIFDFSSQRLLKGFILPASTDWCWFYDAKGSPVHFAEEKDADAYVREFFSIGPPKIQKNVHIPRS